MTPLTIRLLVLLDMPSSPIISLKCLFTTLSALKSNYYWLCSWKRGYTASSLSSSCFSIESESELIMSPRWNLSKNLCSWLNRMIKRDRKPCTSFTKFTTSRSLCKWPWPFLKKNSSRLCLDEKRRLSFERHRKQQKKLFTRLLIP